MSTVIVGCRRWLKSTKEVAMPCALYLTVLYTLYSQKLNGKLECANCVHLKMA